MMCTRSPMVASGKPKLTMKSLTEIELVGVNDMTPIMFWTRNFLLEQGEGIVVDLLLDNKSPSLWEQGGKTPSWKRTRYVNVRLKRLIDITMGMKRSVNPIVCKGVTWKGNV